jgi:hypothetical protein
MRGKRIADYLQDKTWFVSTMITSFEWGEARLVNLFPVLEPSVIKVAGQTQGRCFGVAGIFEGSLA